MGGLDTVVCSAYACHMPVAQVSNAITCESFVAFCYTVSSSDVLALADSVIIRTKNLRLSLGNPESDIAVSGW